jgi:hypothetical protein
MSTYTAQTTFSRRSDGTTAWTLQHPMAATLAALAAAVLAGVLIGILFSAVLSGSGAAAQHRAGGHALATVAAAQHAAVAATATAANGRGVRAERAERLRSPARGGFAVGRTAGAGSGFIEVHVSAADPGGRGFRGRALGAGRIPAAALLRTASVD